MSIILKNKYGLFFQKVGLTTFLAVLFFNQNISYKELGVVSDQFTISINRQFPPFYAFEEVQYKKNEESKTGFETVNIVNEGIAAQGSENSSNRSITTNVVTAKIQLDEIVIDSSIDDLRDDTSEVKIIAKNNFDSTATADIKLNSDTVDSRDVNKQDMSWINTLTPTQKKMLDMAQSAHKVLNKRWDVPSSEDLLRDRIAELQKQTDNQPKASETISVATSSFIKNQKFNGLIEFSEGLAFTNDFAIEIRRQKEGIPLESADVNLKEATFSISLKDNQGLIVAEVINSKGIVEGQGTLSIEELVKPKNGLPRLIVKPIKNSLRGKLLSTNGKFNKNKNLNPSVTLLGTDLPARVSNNGKYIVDAITSNSEVVLEARALQHQPMLTTISLSESADIMLLPEHLIKGLTEILADQKITLNLEKGDSLVWGIVTENGKPIEGAIALIDSGANPVYFGDLQLPDKSMVRTASNGMFVFVNPNPGWNEIEIQTIDKRKVRWNVLTFPGKISQLNAIIPSEDHSIAVRTFDAFTGDPIHAQVSFQQIDDVLDTGSDGIGSVILPNTNNISMVEVTPEEPYLATRQMYSVLLDHLHLPLVSERWIDSIRSQAKISTIPNTTTIVGFVNNSDFEVLDNELINVNSNRIYFNSNGQPVKDGLAGGGFILFNQPLEPNSINIVGKVNSRIISKLVIPTERFINLISIKF